MTRNIASAAVLFVALIATHASAAEQSPDYRPRIDPADFVAEISNPYFPLLPGTTFVYAGNGDSNEVAVTRETKRVMGVSCVVVRDRAWEAGQLVEDTDDWFAQDKAGNVWYFGEASKDIEAGQVVGTSGSWEAGKDGAQPGVIMPAHPELGKSYRQEYYAGEAEDMAKAVSVTDSVTVPYGRYTDCLQTEEWTPLEPGVVEHKFYARGIGHIKTIEGAAREYVLVRIRHDPK